MEEWKIYEKDARLIISDMGNIKCLCPIKKREIPIKIKHAGKYHCVVINNNKLLLHNLVCETFLQKDKDKNYVKHLNGDTHDNRLSNLEWVKRNSGKGRPRKNTEGITISTETFTTGTIELSDRYSSVSTNDDPVIIADYRIEYIKSISKWSVFRIIDDNTIEYKGIHDSKDEAEMAIPDEVYQNEPY